MRIDGRAIAEKILNELKPKVAELKTKGITPTMAVILVSDDPASISYIKQKQKAAETIGAKVILNQLPSNITTDQLRGTIQRYNNDETIHGIIIQRPLPKESPIDRAVLNEVGPRKDIDGFVPGSKFQVPVAMAVLTILEEVFNLEKTHNSQPTTYNSFDHWLKTQCSAVLGRGETAGKPIAEALGEHGCATYIVHSQTPNPGDIIKKMPIIVSCVGKERAITKDMIAPGTILISVGLWRDSTGKLHGDYEEDEIKDEVSYYTPTPGGVGPVNVACLMQNLVLSAQNLSH